MSDAAWCGLVMFAWGGSAAMGQSRPTVLLETNTDDTPGVVLRLHAGDYEVRRSGDRELRVSEVREAGSTMRATRTRIVTKRGRVEVEVDPPTGNNDNIHVIVEVPRCAELEVTMTAGEVQVKEAPCEETTISLHAGELAANLGEADRYREVKATVNVGQVMAGGFDPKGEPVHGGFFPSYRWKGSGDRRFAAHVGTGEIRLGR